MQQPKLLVRPAEPAQAGIADVSGVALMNPLAVRDGNIGNGRKRNMPPRSRPRESKLRNISQKEVDFCREVQNSLPPDKPFKDDPQPSGSSTVPICAVTVPICGPSSLKRCVEHEEQSPSRKRCPALGTTEWLLDDHITFAIQNLMDPPPHVWVATPTQVALMLSSQEKNDPQAGRDGVLQHMWDSRVVEKLILPINSDPEAGKQMGAGLHWSLLVLQRRSDGGTQAINANLYDSLYSIPAKTLHIAKNILRRLSMSRHWQGTPPRPRVAAEGLQRDSFQCGIYCLLAIDREVDLASKAPTANLTISAKKASRLRERLCAMGG